MNGLAKFFAVVLVLVVGLSIYQYLNPKTVEVVVDREVQVKLTPAILDSLKLAFQAEFKATLRPKIIKIADSTRIKALLGEIIALRDSLKGRAKLELTYDTDTLGRYRDTLRVRADFVSDSVSVVFRPRQRDFSITIRDTIPCPDSSSPFWGTLKDVGLVVGGFLIGRGTH